MRKNGRLEITKAKLGDKCIVNFVPRLAFQVYRQTSDV